ncbi:MAG: NUDIX domain-containing protein [Nanoarchaeota archaeon]|nr:NUDIX domain-containing protein [Nanoarchaeota archaeon]MBU4086916.1 NUDIX domain-containing protein [Nanoarchaeota archaeon]
MEQEILKLFTLNEKLKFSEIEKLVKVRSNKLAYHLKHLAKKGILIKENEFYTLSETAEHLIPYLSDKKSPLIVILIRIGNQNKCFLQKRGKRPFKDKLSLPGGRLLVSETIPEAVKRIMKEKFSINAEIKKIISISHEFVKRKNRTLHSFILILTEAISKDNIKLENIKENKNKIIKSDYNLITSNNKSIKIQEFITPSD